MSLCPIFGDISIENTIVISVISNYISFLGTKSFSYLIFNIFSYVFLGLLNIFYWWVFPPPFNSWFSLASFCFSSLFTVVCMEIVNSSANIYWTIGLCISFRMQRICKDSARSSLYLLNFRNLFSEETFLIKGRKSSGRFHNPPESCN